MFTMIVKISFPLPTNAILPNLTRFPNAWEKNEKQSAE